MTRTFAALVASGFLTATAFAQTDPAATAPAPVDDVAPAAATWSDAVKDAFFADGESMDLRAEGDITAKWNALSAEDQAQVRGDCAATREGAVGGADTSAAPEATASEADPLGADQPEVDSSATGQAGSAVAAGDISLSHLVQICSLVDTL